MKVVFQSGKGFYSFLIKLFTFGKYTHCGIVIDGILYQSVIGKGVYSKPWNPKGWTAKDIPVSHINKEDAKKFLIEEIGCGYDLIGVLHFIFFFLKPSKNKWFCSELASEATIKAGFLNRKKKPCYFSSQSLFDTLEKKLNKNQRKV